MIAVANGNVVELHAPESRIADIVPPGKRLMWRNKPTVPSSKVPRSGRNAKREAEYRKRLSGDKPALLQLWRA